MPEKEVAMFLDKENGIAYIDPEGCNRLQALYRGLSLHTQAHQLR